MVDTWVQNKVLSGNPLSRCGRTDLVTGHRPLESCPFRKSQIHLRSSRTTRYAADSPRHYRTKESGYYLCIPKELASPCLPNLQNVHPLPQHYGATFSARSPDLQKQNRCHINTELPSPLAVLLPSQHTTVTRTRNTLFTVKKIWDGGGNRNIRLKHGDFSSIGCSYRPRPSSIVGQLLHRSKHVNTPTSLGA